MNPTLAQYGSVQDGSLPTSHDSMTGMVTRAAVCSTAASSESSIAATRPADQYAADQYAADQYGGGSFCSERPCCGSARSDTSRRGEVLPIGALLPELLRRYDLAPSSLS